MITIKAFLMSIFTFWRTDLPIEAVDFGNQIEIIQYANGAIVSKLSVDNSNPNYKSVINYLLENKSKWKVDISSYAPNILITGNGITLNCMKTNAVIYYQKNNQAFQFSTDPSEVSYCGLRDDELK